MSSCLIGWNVQLFDWFRWAVIWLVQTSSCLIGSNGPLIDWLLIVFQLLCMKLMVHWLLGVKSNEHNSASSTLRLLYTMIVNKGDLMERGLVGYERLHFSTLTYVVTLAGTSWHHITTLRLQYITDLLWHRFTSYGSITWLVYGNMTWLVYCDITWPVHSSITWPVYDDITSRLTVALHCCFMAATCHLL